VAGVQGARDCWHLTILSSANRKQAKQTSTLEGVQVSEVNTLNIFLHSFGLAETRKEGILPLLISRLVACEAVSVK
jgi:hypothetical protein